MPQDQLRVQYPAQGYFDVQAGGARDQTAATKRSVQNQKQSCILMKVTQKKKCSTFCQFGEIFQHNQAEEALDFCKLSVTCLY